MNKRLVSIIALIVYVGALTKILIFKAVALNIGHMRFNFTEHETRTVNFVPFKTIIPYFLGQKGGIISFFELAGNIVLFIPIGLLVPFAYPKMTWKKTFLLAVAAPLLIEGTQLIFRLGIFDIDDLILNALGIIIGFWIYTKYKQKRS